MRSLRTTFLLCLFFILFQADAQDNWIGLQQAVNVKSHAGKPFRYTAAAKTDGTPAVLGLLGVQVQRSGNTMGFFSTGTDKPATTAAWTTHAIEGTLDSDAVAINLNLVCMGNGTCSFDAVQLQVKGADEKWNDVPLANAGFEATDFVNKLPNGWTVFKPSPLFTFGLGDKAFQGNRSLTITGAGTEDNGSIAFIKGSAYVREHYTKQEFQIPMRDGVKLFTAVYTPKDAAEGKKYPIMLHRTPYSVGPYGGDNYSFYIGPAAMVQDGYIFVHQDVRGRYMSEGAWQNMTPHIKNKKQGDVDESTDTWDTIDWLLKNGKYHNGKVGQWGISYPGFYTSAGSIDAHPALKACSPQAPVADFWFDDFRVNGHLW